MGKFIYKFLATVLLFSAAFSFAKAQTLDFLNFSDSMEVCANYKYRVEWKVDSEPEFFFNIYYVQGKFYNPFAKNVSSKQGYFDINSYGGGNYYEQFAFYNTKTKEYFQRIKAVQLDNQPYVTFIGYGGTFNRGHPFKLHIDYEGTVTEFKWYHNGKPIPNSNDDTLYFKSPDYDAAGTYYCEIKNEGCGDIQRSNDVTVNILKGPDIVVQPKTIPFLKGTVAEFKVVAHLTPEEEKIVKFQWWKEDIHSQWINKNGREILYTDTTLAQIRDDQKYAGTRSDFLSVNITGFGDRLNYYCEVILDWGVTFSAPATIKDWFDVKMLTPEFRGCTGGDAVLEVEEVGYKYDEVTFQWYKTSNIMLSDTNKFSGLTTPRLTIKNVQKSDAHTYYCKVRHNKTGYWKISPVSAVVPEIPPHIIWQNKKWVIKHPTDPALTDVVYIVMYLDNPVKCHFQIFKNDKILVDSTGFSIRYNPFDVHGNYILATPADTGAYIVKFWNDCGVTWSDTCHVYWDDEDTVKGLISEGYGGVLPAAGENIDSESADTNSGLSGVKYFTKSEAYLEVFPNPVTSGCRINLFGISEGDNPKVEIYNSLGLKINELKADGIPGGRAAEFYWDGRDLGGNAVPSGLYYAKVFAGGETRTGTIMICR